MFGIFKDITKTAISVASTPIAIAVDIVKLPVTSYENKDPFENTNAVLGAAKKNFSNVIDPNRD